MCNSAIQGCYEEGLRGGTTFQDFLKLPGHTELVPRPEIRAATAERSVAAKRPGKTLLKTLLP
eukprot:352242-Chlamydomonas_euryale.AAC.3